MNNLNLNNLLFDPNSFFREKSKDNTDFKYPILIILIIAVIAIVSSFLVMNQFRGLLPSATSSSISSISNIVVISLVFWGLIGSFIKWIIVTGILYSISYVFDSKGSFKRTLEFVGYGYTPQIFSGLVSTVITYWLTASTDFSSQDPQLITKSMMQTLSNNPLFYLSQSVTILCFLLSAYIWVFALLHARNMSIKNAAITVGVPVGLYIVYLVYIFLFTVRSI
jgi:hypothetical protein